jgi:hypothetical protein
MQREDGGGRMLLGDTTGAGHNHDATVELPFCWEFGFQLWIPSFIHIFENMYTDFHFIDPTGALNIKRNFNTIVLVSTLCFKNTSDFSSKNFF